MEHPESENCCLSPAFQNISIQIPGFLKINSANFIYLFFNIEVAWSLMISLLAQMLKCLPTMQETQVQSLGWEDPLEMEIATHSSILDWRIPLTEGPSGLRSMELQRVRHDLAAEQQ